MSLRVAEVGVLTGGALAACIAFAIDAGAHANAFMFGTLLALDLILVYLLHRRELAIRAAGGHASAARQKVESENENEILIH